MLRHRRTRPPEEAGGPRPPDGPGGRPPADVGDEIRQAVVLLHGMGDQTPMSTLRSFTTGLGLRRLFSSPDRVSGSNELRRLTEPPRAGGGDYTDFFELYWADLAPDSDLRTTALWAVRLLAQRAWWGIPGPVAFLVLLLQGLGLVVVGLLGWAIVAAVRADGWGGVLSFVGRWQAWGALAAFAVQLLLGRFFRAVLSDAMRYLTPRPANIAARRAILDRGLTLLRRLHEDGRYVRIVVVGHSLGSVIAYDLLRCLWDELRHPVPGVAGDQAEIARFDAAADAIDPRGGPPLTDLRRPGADKTGGTDPAAERPRDAEELAAFQRAQFALWRADRADGVPWLVSDFVSLGSPLTYAGLLFDEPDERLGGRRGLTVFDREALKEFPRCPPIRDELEDSRFYTRRYLTADGSVPLKVGHTAAPFGPTRWTNLYYPARPLLRGDVVGGPVAPIFGPGVWDVPVGIPDGGFWGAVRRHVPFAHVSYWWAPRGGPSRTPDPAVLPDASGPPAPNIPALVAALRLGDLEASRDLPRAPQGRSQLKG